MALKDQAVAMASKDQALALALVGLGLESCTDNFLASPSN